MPIDLAQLAAGLIEAAPDAVFVVDDSGDVVLANAEAELMLGYGKDELVGQPIELIVPDALRAGHRTTRSRFAKAPTKRRMGHYEVTARRKDGTILWTAVSLSPLIVEGQRLVIAIARDVTERRAMQDRLVYLSTHDALTGLYGRGYFDEELARLDRGRRFPVSVVVGDVDGLKEINDHSGHGAGDELIRHAAEAMRSAVRSEDVVARVGGDEFAMLLPGVGEVGVKETLRRIRTRAQGAGVEISLGVATAPAPGALTAALAAADKAMYADKAARKQSRGG